jgi:hypothetical protein
MKKVYAIGTMLIDLSEKSANRIKASRLWTLYHDFDEAEKVVMENSGDIFEYYYNVALIEEICVIDKKDPPQPGEEHLWGPPRQWWYHAEYTTEENGEQSREPTVSKMGVPENLKNVCYFWVG